MSGAEHIPTAANAEPTSLAPGGRLAEARRAQNLMPADVARQLKLSVWQVEALEAGHYQQLPGPIFVRGFIRNYAKLVKLDPNELLSAAGVSLPQSVLRPERPPSQNIPFPSRSRPRWPVLACTAAILVAVLAVYEFYWNEPELTAPQLAAVTPASQVAAVTPALVVAQSKSEETPVSPLPAGEIRSAQPAITAAAAAQQITPEAPPAYDAVVVQPGPAKLPKLGEKQVMMAFEQESWVEIRDRNERVIFSQLNRPGTQQSISGMPPFTIVVGNSRGVRLTYEDQPVDLTHHTKIDVARLVLQ